jgi:SAM-dependent methyltransferase
MSVDRWAGGAAYDSWIGGLSRRVAPVFVAWLDVPSGRHWLDVGCGTGALSGTILATADPASVLGVDPSASFLDRARALNPDARARFEVGSADALPVPEGTIDGAVAGLVLNFVPDVARALAEMQRVTAAGGRIGAYVWDYADGMEVIRRYWEAAATVDPAGVAAVGAELFPICEAGALAAAFREAGLQHVEGRAIEVAADYAGFDDYWAGLLSGIGPAPGFNMRLDEDRRAEVRERLRASVETERGGAIHLTARAWAAKGDA